MIRFADPFWLATGAAAVAVLFALLVRAEVLRTRAIALLAGARVRFAGAGLPSALRRRVRIGVLTFAVAMGFVALARPQMGTHWDTVERKGTDLLLVVDTSKSMGADDVKPTRLDRVKLAIRDLVERFPGDRVGIVAFAGDAFVQSPMTLDHGALLETVDALDTSVIARGGTDIGRALEVARGALATEPSHQKSVVLLTDGEDVAGGGGLAEAREAAAEGITVDTIGVGSPEGQLVPAIDERGRVTGVTVDASGKPVRSKLDEGALRAIATATGGTYRALGPDGRGLDQLYEESLAGRAQVEASARTRRVYAERFEVPLALCLLGLVGDALLGIPLRLSLRRRRTARARTFGGAAAAAAALLVALVPARAEASVTAAHDAYAAGRYDEAAKEYAEESAKHPQDARRAFNAGAAAYSAGDFAAAEAAFRRTLDGSDAKLRQSASYNLGNALYRLGEARRAEAREETIERWKAAIDAYDRALAVAPEDEDARFNRDFVKRKLAELEEEKKQEEKKQEEKKQEEKKQDPKQGGQQPDNDPQPQAGGDPPRRAPDGRGKERGEAEPTGDGAETSDGRLGEKDARALLDSLRGEERRRTRGGDDTGQATEPTNGKDW